MSLVYSNPTVLASIKAYTVKEIMDMYKLTINNPKNNRKYVCYPKGYLQWVAQKNILLNQITLKKYVEEKGFNSSSLKSIFKKFVHWCEFNQIVRVTNDNAYSNHIGRNEFVLLFLAHTNWHSKETKRSYTVALNQFFTFLEKKGQFFPSLIDVNDFLNSLKEVHKRSPFTYNQYLAAIKKFIHWCLKQEKITEKISENHIKDLVQILDIKGLTIRKGTYWKDSLTQGQRNDLIAAANSLEAKLVLSLQGFEGLRPNEPAKLKVKNINFEKGTLKIIGKGRNIADEIKLFKKSADLLKQYIKENNLKETDLLFPTLKYHKVYRYFMEALGEAKIKSTHVKLSPHSLRHTAAQTLVKKGIRSEYIQKQMRHVDIQTTQVYLEKIKEQEFIYNLPDDV